MKKRPIIFLKAIQISGTAPQTDTFNIIVIKGPRAFWHNLTKFILKFL